MKKKKYKSKTILITGGSSGIGLNLAKHFLNKGMKVINISRTNSKIKNKNLVNINFDLNNFENYNNLFKKYRKTLKNINYFVYSAGIHDLKPINAFTYQSITKSININLLAPILLSKYLSQRKIFSKLNSIVFISSVMGVVGAPGQVVYSSTKSGVIGLTKSLSLELTKNKIRVNCLSPGVIKESKLFKDYSKSITKDKAQAVIDSHPLRIGSFRDVNGAVEFLINNDSGWFTGQNFILDGGYSSQ